jgi:prevent-host-death family protein
MKQMRASAFKARCLAVMDDVQATGEPVIVTKRGKPVVKVVPVEPANRDIFGFMADKFDIVGDIESPVVPLKDWKIMKKRWFSWIHTR